MTEDFDTNDLLAELQAYVNNERRPGGVTRAEWAENQGIHANRAGGELTKLVEDGVLIREKYRVDGRKMFVYYKANDDSLNESK